MYNENLKRAIDFYKDKDWNSPFLIDTIIKSKPYKLWISPHNISNHNYFGLTEEEYRWAFLSCSKDISKRLEFLYNRNF